MAVITLAVVESSVTPLPATFSPRLLQQQDVAAACEACDESRGQPRWDAACRWKGAVVPRRRIGAAPPRCQHYRPLLPPVKLVSQGSAPLPLLQLLIATAASRPRSRCPISHGVN